MHNKSDIEKIVLMAIDTLNEVRPTENALPKEKSTIFMGEGALLDSMDFVNFIVAVEDRASESLGLTINVAEELNSIGDGAPKPSTVADLVDFLSTRVSSRR